MRKLFYFLAFLFIACVACDSKDEPETPPAPPKPPTPISPKDSIYNMLSGIWDIDSVETYNYGVKASVEFEYVLIGYSKVKYSSNEQLKLDGYGVYRKENNNDRFSLIGYYGIRNGLADIEVYERPPSIYGGYITYYYSNQRIRIHKSEVKMGLYSKDSIISVHRKTKLLPK